MAICKMPKMKDFWNDLVNNPKNLPLYTGGKWLLLLSTDCVYHEKKIRFCYFSQVCRSCWCPKRRNGSSVIAFRGSWRLKYSSSWPKSGRRSKLATLISSSNRYHAFFCSACELLQLNFSQTFLQILTTCSSLTCNTSLIPYSSWIFQFIFLKEFSSLFSFLIVEFCFLLEFLIFKPIMFLRIHLFVSIFRLRKAKLLLPELVRFTVRVVHPSNEILGSDVLQRWNFVLILLMNCKVRIWPFFLYCKSTLW